MKKQYLLVFTFLLFQFSEAQAQDICCLKVDNKEVAEIGKEFRAISQDKMKVIIDEEIKLFTNYLSQSFEYPKHAKYKMLEGNMIVRIVYDSGFESIKVTKSIDPEIDKMVLDNIQEYIKNFDREYLGAPRLAFDLPVNFKFM